jgi:hypothetical protein
MHHLCNAVVGVKMENLMTLQIPTTTLHLVHGIKTKCITKSKSPFSIQYSSRKQNVDASPIENEIEIYHVRKMLLSLRKSNENA